MFSWILISSAYLSTAEGPSAILWFLASAREDEDIRGTFRPDKYFAFDTSVVQGWLVGESRQRERQRLTEYDYAKLYTEKSASNRKTTTERTRATC